MYKRFIIVFFVFVIGFVTVVSATYDVSRTAFSLQQLDKKTEISANLRQAKYMMEHNNYVGAKKKLDRVLELDPSNDEASNLLAECSKIIEQELIKERAAFQEARNNNTVEALKSFIDSYPNSGYRKDAENRIEDFELWSIAKRKNTIESYEAYLRKSQIVAFKSDAIVAITNIKSEQEWNIIKNTVDVSLLSGFINNYPKSSHLEEAKYRQDLLLGESSYMSGDRDSAYKYLINANSYSELIGLPREHLKELQEEKTYNEIINTTNINSIKSFLSSLSFGSKYYDATSNRLAILLGSELHMNSSDSEKSVALSYATDEITRSTVQRYIQKVEDERAEYNKRMRIAAHKRWWRENFRVGIDGDICTNVNSADSEAAGSNLIYSAGLVARFGNYSHAFNLVLGVKYRWFMFKPAIVYDDYDYYYYSNNEKFELIGGMLCFPLNFRFNLGGFSSNCSWFLGAGGEYGFKINETKDFGDMFNNFYVSAFPQLGITSPHFDFSLYYKYYIECPYKKVVEDMLPELNCKYMLGLQIAFYF